MIDLLSPANLKFYLAGLIFALLFWPRKKKKKATADKLEKTCRYVNPSLYLFSPEAFYYGITQVDNNNAQREYYLTDIVKHLAAATEGDDKEKFRIIPVASDDDNIIQGFNSPDELLAIEDYLRSKKAIAQTGKIALKPRLPFVASAITPNKAKTEASIQRAPPAMPDVLVIFANHFGSLRFSMKLCAIVYHLLPFNLHI